MARSAVVVAVAALALMGPAAAAAGQGAPAVGIFAEGPQATQLRRKIVAKLPAGLQVVDRESLSAAMARAGVPMALGRDAPTDWLERLVEAGGAVEASLVVGLRYQPREKRTRLVVIDAETGAVRLDEAIVASSGGRKSTFRSRRSQPTTDLGAVLVSLNPLLAQLITPLASERAGEVEAAAGGAPTGAASTVPGWATPEAKPAVAADSSEAKAEPEPRRTNRQADGGLGLWAGDEANRPRPRRRLRGLEHASLIATLAYEMTGRRYGYSGSPAPAGVPYRLDGASAVALQLEVFPLALTQMAGLADLGFHARLRQSLGTRSSPLRRDDIDLPTAQRDLLGELIYRATFDGGQLRLGIGYGNLGFHLPVAEDDPLRAQIPDIAYTFLRFGLGLRVGLGPFNVSTSAGYRHLLSTDRRHQAAVTPESSAAFDLEAGLTYELFEHVELVCRGDYAHLRQSLMVSTAAERDTRVAVDQYYGVSLGLTTYW